MCQCVNIESTTVLSDCRFLRERHFQRLAGPIIVSEDLKYDVLCL